MTQDVQVSEDKEFRKSYQKETKLLSDLNTIKENILCYHGHKPVPRWMDTERALLIFSDSTGIIT